jgi:cell fate (sporulation/competence/biofilm development) regulator YlbF (YheA/YmcA/DUF963 family)
MEFTEIIRLSEELVESFKDDPRFKALRALERELDVDSGVVALSETMRRCALEYEAAPEGGPDKTIAQKRLHETKLALDRHPLVRRYYEAYRPVRELYDLIQNEIFAPFNQHVCGGDR